MMTMTTTSNEDHQLSAYNCMPQTAMQLQKNMNSLVQVPMDHDNNIEPVSQHAGYSMTDDEGD